MKISTLLIGAAVGAVAYHLIRGNKKTITVSETSNFVDNYAYATGASQAQRNAAAIAQLSASNQI